MTVKEAKNLLKALPDDATIALLDRAKNAAEDSLGEGCNAGCYTIEDIRLLDKSEVPDDTDPWVAIQFTDPDYPYAAAEEIEETDAEG